MLGGTIDAERNRGQKRKNSVVPAARLACLRFSHIHRASGKQPALGIGNPPPVYSIWIKQEYETRRKLQWNTQL